MRFRINIIAFVVGTGVLQRQAELPELVWIWGVLGLVIVTQFLKHAQSSILAAINSIVIVILFVGLGFFWAATVAHWRLSDSLPPQWEQQDIQIVGVVANLPHRIDRSALSI